MQIQQISGFKAWQYGLLLNRLIERDNTYIYTSEFDDGIHEELKRSKRCIERSLLDYYQYQNTLNRELSDIVFQEVLNEKETDYDNVLKVTQYVEELRLKLNSVDVTKITKEEFNWEELFQSTKEESNQESVKKVSISN
eukprot:403374139